MFLSLDMSKLQERNLCMGCNSRGNAKCCLLCEGCKLEQEIEIKH